MNIFLSLVEVLNIENHSLGKCKHESVTFTMETFNIKMSQICITLKQLAFLKFHLMVTSLQHFHA